MHRNDADNMQFVCIGASAKNNIVMAAVNLAYALLDRQCLTRLQGQAVDAYRIASAGTKKSNRKAIASNALCLAHKLKSGVGVYQVHDSFLMKIV